MKTTGRIESGVLAVLAVLLCVVLAEAAEPPARINYQGVLRDVGDTPLEGTFHMIFRFWNAETGGDEILIDEHPSGGESEVIVNGGLFNVELGSGDLFDGAGPGTYISLAEVFRDNATVWLEVEVDGEVLTPRIRVVSAAYALNADHLDGNSASYFLDTSSAEQTKSGPLVVDAYGQPGHYGISSYGDLGGGFFADNGGTSVAYIGSPSFGVDARGDIAGGYFLDLDSGSYAHVGIDNYGIWSVGALEGGYFGNLEAHSLTRVAVNDVGIWAVGENKGGTFDDSNGTGHADVAYGDLGIQAIGSEAGGSFVHTSFTSWGDIGKEEFGVVAVGPTAGGSFWGNGASGHAFVGNGDFGIKGYGNEAGGYFGDTDGSSTVWVARNDNGISSYGSLMGGYFSDTGGTAYAWIASREDEFNSYGIHAFGDSAGGYFEDRNGAGYAMIGVGDWGVDGYGGTDTGGGIRGTDLTSGCYGHLAHYTDTTSGNCAKNFLQNHPYEKDKIIVYTSLEGDEVGTYTRGSARLENGMARVRLGETFQWVTNPDLGLTAHLTPRGQAADLYVERLNTREMVVRADEGSPPDAAFDYIVHGLRIGFEEASVVREKALEAYLPLMDAVEDSYQRFPERRRFNALERFKNMTASVLGSKSYEPDLSAAEALRAAIGVYDPEIHVDPRRNSTGRRNPVDPPVSDHVPSHSQPSGDPVPGRELSRREPAERPSSWSVMNPDPSTVTSTETERSDLAPAEGDVFPVSEPVERGDLLVLDPDVPGRLRRANSIADPAIVGITTGDPVDRDGVLHAPVAGSGFAVVKVDATYGAVRAGDLLTSSPTPGHAMTTLAPAPGTVIGKALEPLNEGSGLIRVLLMPR